MKNHLQYYLIIYTILLFNILSLGFAYAQSKPKFFLYNPSGEEKIREIQNQDTISIDSLDKQRFFNVVAEEMPADVEKIVFKLVGNSAYSMKERELTKAPYAVFGVNDGGDLNGDFIRVGEYKLNYIITFTNQEVLEDSLTFRFDYTELKFALIDVKANQRVAQIKDGDIIDLTALNLEEFSIEVITYPLNTSEVYFQQKEALDPISQKERLSPFAMFGDDMQGNYYGESANPGDYTFNIRASFYHYGYKSVSKSLSFRFVNPKEIPFSEFDVYLVNADSDEIIAPLNNEQPFNLKNFGAEKFSVVTTSYPVKSKSIRYTLKTPVSYQKVENRVPVSLFGDNQRGDYLGQSPQPGVYELKIEAFDQTYSNGNRLADTTIYFSFKVDDFQIYQDKTLGGNLEDNLKHLLIDDTDGTSIWIGNTRSRKTGDVGIQWGCSRFYSCRPTWVTKVDQAGSVLWQHMLYGSIHTEALKLDQDKFLIGRTGYHNITKNDPNYNVYLTRIDGKGNRLWNYTLDLPGYSLNERYYDNTQAMLKALQVTPNREILLGLGSDIRFRSCIYESCPSLTIGSSSYAVAKLSYEGDPIWVKEFQADDNEYLESIIPLQDGNYLLAGYSNSGISGDKTGDKLNPVCDSIYDDYYGRYLEECKYDYWLIKIDKDGNKIWDKTIGSQEIDFLIGGQELANGDVILWGDSHGDFDLARIDAEANVIWNKSFPAKLSAFIPLQEGGGLYAIGGTLNGDYWLGIIDEAGLLLQEKTFGGSGLDELSTLALTPEGDILVGGSSKSGISGDKSEASRGLSDYWVIRYKSDVTLIPLEAVSLNEINTAKIIQPLKGTGDKLHIKVPLKTETQELTYSLYYLNQIKRGVLQIPANSSQTQIPLHEMSIPNGALYYINFQYADQTPQSSRVIK